MPVVIAVTAVACAAENKQIPHHAENIPSGKVQCLSLFSAVACPDFVLLHVFHFFDNKDSYFLAFPFA